MVLRKKTILTISLFLLLFLPFNFIEAESKIDFFYSQSCPHCAKEKAFLNDLEKEHSEVKINKLLITENVELLKKKYREYKVPQKEWGLVPITFIGENYFLGFNEEIEKKIENCLREICPDKNISQKTSIPIIGEIEPANYSLPALAVILGFFDGFNVCSLGALVMILGLVLALKKRKKILAFGGLFILTTAVIYGLLIVVWYQVFSWLSSYLGTMEKIIGVLGIIGGIYFLKQFIRYRKYGPTCEMEKGKGLINKFSSKIKNSLNHSRNIFLIMGVILLFAAIITIVEFPCSAAIPVFFAGLLAEADLSSFSYLIYIALFVFFYMLDEIIIFLIAFLTMNLKLTSPKATTWITLFESIILFGLGLYYLFPSLI